MKKIILIVTFIFVAVAVFCTGFYLLKPVKINTEQTITEITESEQLDIDKLKKQNMKLYTPNTPATISEEEAIKAAKANSLYVSDMIKVNYYMMSNDGGIYLTSKNNELRDRGYMDKTPVYIVSFNGVKMYVMGPIVTDKPDNPNNSDAIRTFTGQYNMVIDATTGEAITGFSIN